MTPATEQRLHLAAVLAAATFLLCAGYILWRPGRGEPDWIRMQRDYLASRGSTESPRVREAWIGWACNDTAAPCKPTPERCTTCHAGVTDDLGGRDPGQLPTALQPHPSRDAWLGKHPPSTFGCVACHGGDGIALERDLAHRGLLRFGRAPNEVPEVEARCGACHVGSLHPAVTSASPSRAAWARFLAVRAGGGAPRASQDVTEANAVGLAPALDSGRHLFRSLRCGACHAASEPSVLATPMRTLGLRSSVSQLVAGLRDHEKRSHVALPKDDVSVSSLAAHLAEVAQPEVATALLHRASVPGSGAEEGRILFDRLACAACHSPSNEDLAGIASTRTADWIAYWLADPARANLASRMPSLRLSPREAASLATHLTESAHDATPRMVDRAIVACPTATGPKSMPRSACGEALATTLRCAACHSAAPSATIDVPSLATYGDSHDGASAMNALDAHGARATGAAPAFSLSEGEKRELATFLVSETTSRVRPDLLPRGEAWEAVEGARLFAELGCGGCHATDEATKLRGPSLFGEGLRVRPQWLFAFLRDPARHAVRPPFHPEWAYRDLVPSEHASARMPTFKLSDTEATSLVRFFTGRDGASYPYSGTTTPVLTGEVLAAAIGDMSHKDRGACLSCHTIGQPDVDRARADGDRLGPPLALAHDRLRPDWIEACILQPDVWVGPSMPVLFHDPLGEALAWPVRATSEPPKRALDQAELLRDLVLMLRERTVLPPAGAEGLSPALGLGDL